MTFTEACDVVEEIRALELVRRAVQSSGLSPAWRAAIVAIDDRLRLLRYCLEQEDPALVAAVLERLALDRRLDLPSAAEPLPSWATDGRVH
jgi:hypothetical protein